MKYCDKCRVQVAGDRRHCPLCQSILAPANGPDEEIFPVIPTIYRRLGLFFRIMLLCSAVAAIVSVAINLMLPGHGWWSLFVLGGLLCFWASLWIAVWKRHNIPKSLLYQVVLVSGGGVIWDLCTHWRGWSIDYVIPIACCCAMLAMAIVSGAKKMPIEDYMIYLIVDGIFGIVPIVFFLTGCLHVLYPSIICVAASMITLITLLIFEGQNMINEIKRRLHM